MHEAISAGTLLCKATEELVVGVPVTLSHIQSGVSVTLPVLSSIHSPRAQQYSLSRPACYEVSLLSAPTLLPLPLCLLPPRTTKTKTVL